MYSSREGPKPSRLRLARSEGQLQPGPITSLLFPSFPRNPEGLSAAGPLLASTWFLQSPGDTLTPVHQAILNGGERDFLWAGVRKRERDLDVGGRSGLRGQQGAADTVISSRDRSGATREAR